jgi:hypothetical protein
MITVLANSTVTVAGFVHHELAAAFRNLGALSVEPHRQWMLTFLHFCWRMAIRFSIFSRSARRTR